MDNVPIRVNDQNARSQNTAGRPGAPAKKPTQKKNKIKQIILSVFAVIFVAALVVGGLFLYKSTTGASIDSGRYQAVFFTNGQVYFGKLQTLNGEYMKLSDIYYLQTKTAATDSTNPQATTAEGTSDVELVKLGNEVHGPEDEMILSKDQVLFFENLKTDGTVSKSIAISQAKK